MKDITILAKQIVLTPLEDLHYHPKNPRKGDLKGIVESFRENGVFLPVLVQKSTGHVICGNHRLRAAHQTGMTHVPAVFVDVDDDRALRMMLADNRTSDLAENDLTKLAVLLHDLAADTDSLAGTCFTADELATMLVKAEPPQEFREFDESAAGKVKFCECPACGHKFPR